MNNREKGPSNSIIHKEGINTILLVSIFLIICNTCVFLFLSEFLILSLFIYSLSVVVFFLVVYFFRVPKRIVTIEKNKIVAPADGKVVVIEQTFEKEYFNDYRTQVSIFMSPLNVHVNWAPVTGIVNYFKYHPGRFLVAWKPKASEENERFTTVFKTTGDIEILMRQIAGKLARRIVSYVSDGKEYKQGDQVGIIKFGSRVDIFLPPEAKINVQINQKVKGNKTVLAEF